jgi:hypothetical protein
MKKLGYANDNTPSEAISIGLAAALILNKLRLKQQIRDDQKLDDRQENERCEETDHKPVDDVA